MNKIIGIMLLGILVSCNDTPKREQEADRIMDSFTLHMKNNENFFLYGSGGAMMEDIEEIILAYKGKRNVNVDEARKILVINVEKLLAKINADLAIRPYLHNFPFNAKNLGFKLSFYNDQMDYVDKQYISYLSLIDGVIRYANYIAEDDDLQLVYSEPYETALRIVNESTK